MFFGGLGEFPLIVTLYGNKKEKEVESMAQIEPYPCKVLNLFKKTTLLLNPKRVKNNTSIG
jgi:hypothetical protein